MADGGLTTLGDADEIKIGNETYNNASSTSTSVPDWGTENLLTTSYVKAGVNIPNTDAGANYYRFWLDIPAAQAAGDYNNSVSFKGITTTGDLTGC